MASKEAIDLSGKEQAEPEEKKRRDSRTQRDREGDASSIYANVNRREREWERDIRLRCERTQARIVEWLEGRGDEELATVVQEDGRAMIGGLIYFCGAAAWLRAPILQVMTFVEPVLAFGRLTKVLLTRWAGRRQRIAEEREAAIREYEAQQAAEQPLAQQPTARHNIVE